MTNIDNIGVPQVANRAFVPLAIEAGIEGVIQGLVGLAVDKRTLLIQLVETLGASNPALAAGLNLATLDAILAYISRKSAAPVVEVEKLPRLLDESGPASVSAGRDGGVPSQVNVTFSAPPAGYVGEIYLDGVFVKSSAAAPVGGFVNDFIAGVAAGAHTVRVLFRSAEGSQTRFGPIAPVG